MDAQERLQALRARHAAWSAATFGNVSAVGPAKHLAKEALEVAAAPHDPIEHGDCQMLLWDMQRRAGISDDQIADAIDTKMSINESRIWPAPMEGEAREHDRSGDTASHCDTAAARDVLAERRRQVSDEGWTPEHDDTHSDGEMAGAAACYALYRSHLNLPPMGGDLLEQVWPWAAEWWKPTDRRRDLVKAAALILAEIERLDRATLAENAK